MPIMRLVRVEDSQHDLFAEQRRQVLTRKSIARFFDRRILMRPSCGHAALGDVQA